ncbi:hypothetical protein N7448_004069 [Penicillium atrosanguineum]|uniref:uncharacterized protein n=1 Tax=Penicillium atrosanguineum TaxID=1132637 RepID=UPI0023971F0B|nr:uncharacterized protein N7443_003032 [Penicillium atrosanguineum]KAJ5140661.1 hypothetical protein N7448_004069 [Penicillium atrosanguineum]KAJ5310571.1 hypothetical protein N7443_003032 [Penicillium atrosanguineum]
MAPMPSKSDSLQIINAGLFRTATKSMALAYQILGFKTHHGLLEKVTETPWIQLEQAAEATWPNAPGTRPRKPYTRGDWSALWGGYDAVTDLASPFALELIKAYPEAKVVIVQRDFDSWWPSFKAEILDRVMLQPMATINGFLGLHLMGIPAVQAMRKIHFGFFGAQSRAEILNNAKDVYEEYYADVRAAVPAEQRLEYRVGDGWEPLCEFLKVDIPDMPFPRENDAGEHDGEAKARTRLIWANGLKVVVPILVLGLAVRIAFKRS